MGMDANFKLQRLVMLLDEQVRPGCVKQTLSAEDIAAIQKEISWESERVYVEILKVMCRNYTDDHLRRCLEVHLGGVEYLQERLEELKATASTLCLQLFDLFNEVLGKVQMRLGTLQRRHFEDDAPVEFTDKWWRADRVMQELGISQRTLYTYTQEGMFVTSKRKRTTFYSKDSVLRIK